MGDGKEMVRTLGGISRARSGMCKSPMTSIKNAMFASVRGGACDAVSEAAVVMDVPGGRELPGELRGRSGGSAN